MASMAKENNNTTELQTTANTMLVYDVVLQDGKFRNYRSVEVCLHNNDKISGINLQGFTDLKMSGSAQFSEPELQYILQHANGQVFIVDLRQESHGFVNNAPVTWYSYRNQFNLNKTPAEIYQEEKKLLSELAAKQEAVIHKIKKLDGGNFESVQSTTVKIKEVESEQALVNQFKANYIRFYVLDKHKPSDLQIDEFIEFVDALPKNAWLHFHCRAGKGRTTTFMVMYDMLKNANQVGFEDILRRNMWLGGTVLNRAPIKKISQWKAPAAAERYKFIKKFYDYVISHDRHSGDNKKTWSEWTKSLSS